ncbi:hypothetical protein ACLB2K_006522 [Fragaria x ananassa]
MLALQEIDVRMPYRSVISPIAADGQLEVELYKLMTMQTRVFVVHMLPSLESRIFEKARKIGMIEHARGIGFENLVPSTKALEDFRVRWKRQFLQDNPTAIDVNLHVFGLCAYDAAKALAMAVEKVGSTKNLTFQNMNSSGSFNYTNIFGVSQIGPELIQALLTISFRGIGGNFSLPKGQLPASTFQIVNVIGNGENVVRFWTPENGLLKSLSSAKRVSRSYSSNDSLGSIIWPGDRLSAPKATQIPTRGRTLKILVPAKKGFNEFVNVKV